MQAPGPHNRAASEKMARPGLLSWPLVCVSECSMGEGGDPWGQILPVLWSPQALPIAGQGEPTAHKQGAEPGHEPRSHLPAWGRSRSQGSSEPRKTDPPPVPRYQEQAVSVCTQAHAPGRRRTAAARDGPR